jgi:hypothetical protein
MTHNRTRFGLVLAVSLVGCGVCAAADNPAAYPSMAPLAQYLTPDLTEEIALARSAAPPSIAANAEVLTLGVKGYDSAVKGSNGFVCIVVRAWDNDFDSPTCGGPSGPFPDYPEKKCANGPKRR